MSDDVLTPEFLANLDKQKQEHEAEMACRRQQLADLQVGAVDLCVTKFLECIFLSKNGKKIVKKAKIYITNL